MEMMVVIAIMGLLLVLVVNRSPARSPTLTLRAATGEVAEALRAGRSDAITAGRPVAFLIAPASRTFGTTGSVHVLPPGVALSLTAHPPGPIVFQPDGSASAGIIRLLLGHLGAVVRVDWLTGRISIEPVHLVAEN